LQNTDKRSASVDFCDLRYHIHIRAFNFGGSAAMLFGYARKGNFRIDISEAILQETRDVLREKFQRDPYEIHDIRQKLEALCNRVARTQVLEVIKEDPDDNRILECAAAARSDYVVSEDQDLLRLGEYEGIPIITVANFLNIVLGGDL
jgi:putative PIN family toxin of toxin-antitoxin system